MTLLYQGFYDKYLKQILLQKLEELDIWGIGTQKFPYDGYIPVKLTFSSPATKKSETL